MSHPKLLSTNNKTVDQSKFIVCFHWLKEKKVTKVTLEALLTKLYRPCRSLVSSRQKCCLRNGPSLSRQNNNCRHRAKVIHPKQYKHLKKGACLIYTFSLLFSSSLLAIFATQMASEMIYQMIECYQFKYHFAVSQKRQWQKIPLTLSNTQYQNSLK